MGVTVILAARDEEANLGLCLESLIQQAVVEKVLVVDDHSRDNTLAIAQAFSVRDRRVVPLQAPPLPTGWVGKSHALQFAAEAVKTPYLLFTDADVVLAPGIITAAVHEMRARQLDHLSGHFFVDCQSIAEEVCAPVLVLSSALALFGTAKSLGAATGAFNLLRTTTYWDCGGHMPIKGCLVDDVALGRHLKSHGARTRFVFLGEAVKVRVFIGFRGFMSAVARSSLPFLRFGFWTVSLLACMAMILMASPLICLFGTVALRAMSPNPVSVAGSVVCLAPLPYLLGLLTICLCRRYHNGRPVFCFLYPVAAVALPAAVLRAAVGKVRRRPVMWRGREYFSG
jgi:glycosyltransferase involved in cell wall biosynthesis